MNGKRLAFAAVAALSMGFAAAPASASVLFKISGTGFWAANAPSTAYSEPLKQFSFSFLMPATYSYVDLGVVKVIDPTEISNLRYSLDGVQLATSISKTTPPNCTGSAGLLCGIEIISPAGGGGMTLDFADASVDLYGVDSVDIGSQGKLKHGGYSFNPNINGDPSSRDGLINEGDGPTVVSIVPEPAAWAMMLVGLGFTGAAIRAKRRDTVFA
jgi:hypothetical protein